MILGIEIWWFIHKSRKYILKYWKFNALTLKIGVEFWIILNGTCAEITDKAKEKKSKTKI